MTRSGVSFFILLVFVSLQSKSQYVLTCNRYLTKENGTSAYLQGYAPDLFDNLAFTVAFWMRKETNQTGTKMGLFTRQSEQSLIELSLNEQGELKFATNVEIAPRYGGFTPYSDTYSSLQPAYQRDSVVTTGFVLDSGVFYHIAVTYDSLSKNAKIYVNGQVKASKQFAGLLRATINYSWYYTPFTFGCNYLMVSNNVVPNSYFKGYIDEVAITGHKAMTATDIDTLALRTMSPAFYSRNVITAHYKLEEGSGGVGYNSAPYTYTTPNEIYLLGATWIHYICPPVNVLPYASAGNDITITLPVNSVTLTGGGVDVDGTIAGYSWSQVSGPSQAAITSPASPQTQVNSLIQGIYKFRLQVTDNNGTTGTDDVVVTVNPASGNVPPIANAGKDTSILLPFTDSITLSGSSSVDQDGAIVNYQWSLISPANGAVTIVSPGAETTIMKGLQVGTYVFRLTVTDDDGESSSDDVQVIVWDAQIKLIDPNPSLIMPDGSLNPDISGLDLNAVVVGASTDGVSKVLIYCNSTVPIRFQIQDPSDGKISSFDNPGNLVSDLIIAPNNGKVVAIYTPPDGFGPETNSQTNRIIELWLSLPSTADHTEIPLKLVTPPVVLVHGMWSNSFGWIKDKFFGYLVMSGFDAANIMTPNYEKYSANTFNPYNSESFPGINIVANSINAAIIKYREVDKLAATQVDVVAHSLGGLMTRAYSQGVRPFANPVTKSPSNFVNPWNYGKGYVHKLITLGTPHRGSPFGPELWNHQNEWVRFPIEVLWGGSLPVYVPLSMLLSIAGNPIGSVHKDFGIESEGLSKMDATLPFKSYAITGDATGQTVGYAAINILCFWIFDKTLDEVMESRFTNSTLPNDLMVPLNSQKGSTNGKDTLLLNLSHSFPGTNTDLSSLEVKSKVVRLLLSENESDFSLGFPKSFDIPLDDNSASQKVVRNQSTNSTARQTSLDTQTIKITSPVIGANYPGAVGTSITFSFESFGGAVPTHAMFIVKDIGWFPVPNGAPYSVTISLPENVPIGRIPVLLIAVDTSGLRMADTSSIIINPTGILDSITVDPLKIDLDSTFRDRSVMVLGYFRNGNETKITNLTNGSTGTSYSTLFNNVFTVSPDGYVQALNAGTDTLIIVNHGKTLRVPVTVAGNFQQAALYPNAIDFPVIADKTIGDAPFGLSASASSGDDITFSIISGHGVLENGILAMTGPGKITVSASQSGNVYFAAASPVTRTFCVNPKQPSLITGDTLFCPGTKTYTFTRDTLTNYSWQVTGGSIISESNDSVTINWTASGLQSLELKPEADGCFGLSRIVTVHVLSQPPTPAITSNGPTTICSGANVQLTSSALSNNQWYKDGQIITGATSNSYTVSESGNYVVRVTSEEGCSSVSASTVIATNDNPPVPVITPGATPVFCEGGNVLLTSSSTLNNQWYKNGQAITGATTNSYSVTTGGDYTVKVTGNGGCFSVSVPTTVTVNQNPPLPVITANAATTFCEGESVVLTSSVITGNQWYKNDTPITGATSASYTASTGGDYTVRVTNAAGCVSISELSSIIVNATPPVPVVTPSGNPTFCDGNTLILTSSAGTGNQWYRNGAIITGANANTYSVTTSGAYSVKIINNNGCMSGSTSIDVTVNNTPPIPTITANGATAICTGESVVLSSSGASGNQWYKNDIAISSATNQSYTANEAGNYLVKITTPQGCSASSTALAITVKNSGPAPVISASGAISFCQGDSVLLVSTISNSYQWYRNNVPILLATQQGLTVKITGNYLVKTSGAAGCPATSNEINIAVTPRPARPVIMPVNGYLQSSVVAGVQWYLDGLPIAGATTASFHPETSGDYTVRGSQNGCESDLSEPYKYIKIVPDSVSLEDAVKIFPNPFQNSITITSERSSFLWIDLYDITGKYILFKELSPGVHVLDLSSLQRGVYIAVIVDGLREKRIRKMLIKM